MNTLRSYPDYCKWYVERHPRAVAYCQRLLGSLETEQDATRWAYISFCAYSYSVLRAPFAFLLGHTIPIQVTILRKAFLAVLCDHCASASLAQRQQEQLLFFPLLGHKDFVVRTGAMQHIACMGTREAIPHLREVLHSAQGHDRRQALLSLAYIVSDGEIAELVHAAGSDAWVIARHNWPEIHRTRGNVP